MVDGGLTSSAMLVGSVALLLFLLRYLSIRLILLGQNNIKEVSMDETLNARTHIFLGSVFETIWAVGVGGIVGHLSA